LLGVIAIVASLAPVASAQRQSGRPVAATSGPALAPAPFASLRWRQIGPAVFGGRFTDIEVARTSGEPDRIYVAASTGGVFESTNGGASWTPIFDAMNTMMSMADIAIAPSNPDIVWVGTGEWENPPHRWGEGVFKSIDAIDAGKTWTRMGLAESRHIGRIAIDAANPDVVFVAAQGNIWGPSPERGLFKTTDGGRTWKKVLYVDENTGANDVAFDPTNPRVILASTYTRQRKSFGGIPTGSGSGLYKSTDGGETWTPVTRGLPTGEKGRIGIFYSRVQRGLVYADVEVRGAVYPGGGGNPADCPPPGGRATSTRGGFESGEGGVYRSLDGGDSWEHVSSRIDQPSGFFIQMRPDPKDANRVYRLGTGFYVSDDQGKTFRTMNTTLHGDYMSFWIDPDNNNHLIVGNDGGLAISWDRGETWDHRDNVAVAQFYETWVDNRDPYWVCGGAQDNGMWCTPSATRNRNGIGNADSWSMGGGDGMHVRVDPFDTTFALFEPQSGAGNQGSMQRLNTVTRQRQIIKPGAGRPISCFEAEIPAAGRVQPPLRWGWDTPILFSTVTPGVIYTAANVVFRSTDHGGSWTKISPDLSSRVDRDTITILGRKLGAVNYSPNGTNVTDPTVTSIFGQITSLGESRVNPRVLYAGTEDGLVQVTRDGGATWTNITKNIPSPPFFGLVTTVLPSAHIAGRVYVTYDAHASRDDNAYVYVSDDFGQHFRKITDGLPAAPVYRIAEHPRDANVLALGNAKGIDFSNDGGKTWISLNTNLPTVPVTGVTFQARDNALIAGTYGRGIWILDDVAPLQRLTTEALKSDAAFVSATRGRQWNVFASTPDAGVGEYYAPNPEFDPVVTYYLRASASDGATITIRDAAGAVVRTLSGPSVAGLNRVTWDMHMTPAVPSGVVLAGRGGGGRGGAGEAGSAGPRVLPGTYSIAVRVPGVSQEMKGSTTLVADPLESATVEQRRARNTLLLDLYAAQKSLTDASSKMTTPTGDSVSRVTNAEITRLFGLSASLMRSIESFSGAPSADERQQVAWVREDVNRVMSTINRAKGTSGGRGVGGGGARQ
jgi:photosystem II stability/assembly factor-like uncharacterized protein